MTTEEQSWIFFSEWVKENPEFPYTTDDMIAFASFILQKGLLIKTDSEESDICLKLENYLRAIRGIYS